MNERPNILHIITHDTGRHIGCYGAALETPNIDALSRESLMFSNCFCTSPQCCASRSSMFSGMSPQSCGMMGQISRGWFLRKDVPYLPLLLRENGYKTLLCGIQHETAGDPRELGYERILPSDTRRAGKITDAVTDYLRSSPTEPFFVSAGFKDTHRPFPTSEREPDGVEVPRYLPDTPETRRDFARFETSVQHVDQSIGRIVQTLKQTGLEEDTLLVFTTDHGPPFPGAKCTLTDRGTGIFLLMRGPGLDAGPKEVDSLLSNMDLAPTLLDYASIDVPAMMEGQSFLPLLRGEKESVRAFTPSQLTYHAAYDPMRSIRTRRFRYIRSFEFRPELLPANTDDSPSKEILRGTGPFQRSRPYELLFDMQDDAGETENVASREEYAETLHLMRKQLAGWMQEIGDPLLEGPVSPPNPNEVTPVWADTPHERWNIDDEL